MSIICFFCSWWKLSGLCSVWPEETKSPWHAQEDSKAFSRLLRSTHTECTGLLGIVSWQAKMNEDCCSYHQMLQKGGVGCRTREVQMFPLKEQVVSASEQCCRGFCKGAWCLFEVHTEKQAMSFFFRLSLEPPLCFVCNSKYAWKALAFLALLHVFYNEIATKSNTFLFNHMSFLVLVGKKITQACIANYLCSGRVDVQCHWIRNTRIVWWLASSVQPWSKTWDKTTEMWFLCTEAWRVQDKCRNLPVNCAKGWLGTFWK